MLDINNPRILDLIRSGDSDAISAITPHLMRLITSYLYKFGKNDYRAAIEFKNDTLTEIAVRKSSFPVNIVPIKYLSTIAINLINRHYNYRKKHPRFQGDCAELLDHVLMDDPGIRQFELNEMIISCMKMLPTSDQDLITLLIQDKTPDEIIDSLNYKNKDTLYSRKYQVLEKFRRLLKIHGNSK